MPYNEEGFYIESEPCHGKDAERRFADEGLDMADRIRRLERLMDNPRAGSRRERWTEERNALLIELHDHERAGRAYDRRLAAAREDMTGQDEELFFGDRD